MLERPDAAAIATGGVERTTLALDAAEGVAPPVWRIAELHSSAAFTYKVDRLLSRIGSMTTLDLVTSSADQHAKYGLTMDRALRVRLSTSSSVPEEATVDLLIAPTQDHGTWVRTVDDPRVWRIARFNPPSPSPRSWFDDSSLMPLSDLAIKTVTLSGPGVGGSVEMGEQAGDLDRFVDGKGNALSSLDVLDLFKRLRTLYPVNVVGPKEAGAPWIDEPWLVVEAVPQVGGKPFRIEFEAPATVPASGTPGEAPAQSTEVRAALLQGTTIVTVSTSTVEKIAETAMRLRESVQNR